MIDLPFRMVGLLLGHELVVFKLSSKKILSGSIHVTHTVIRAYECVIVEDPERIFLQFL